MGYTFTAIDVPKNTSTAVNPFHDAVNGLWTNWNTDAKRSAGAVTFDVTVDDFLKAKRLISAAAKAVKTSAVIRPVNAPDTLEPFTVTFWLIDAITRVETAETKAKRAMRKAVKREGADEERRVMPAEPVVTPTDSAPEDTTKTPEAPKRRGLLR